MPNPPEVLVFDTGPLSHFAKQSWLGALRFITSAQCAVIPDAVVVELRAGLPQHPYLDLVLNASWLTSTQPDQPRRNRRLRQLLLAPGGQGPELG